MRTARHAERLIDVKRPFVKTAQIQDFIRARSRSSFM
jgi:hypothetical protein